MQTRDEEAQKKAVQEYNQMLEKWAHTNIA